MQRPVHCTVHVPSHGGHRGQQRSGQDCFYLLSVRMNTQKWAWKGERLLCSALKLHNWEWLTDTFVSLFDAREACCLPPRLWAWRWRSATLTGRTPPEATRKQERPLRGETQVVCRGIMNTRNEWEANGDRRPDKTWGIKVVWKRNFSSTGWQVFSLFHSLQENRPLPKSFFTTMMEIEKKQVRVQQL